VNTEEVKMDDDRKGEGRALATSNTNLLLHHHASGMTREARQSLPNSTIGFGSIINDTSPTPFGLKTPVDT